MSVVKKANKKVCNVEGCDSETILNVSVSFYPLPSNLDLRLRWCEALGVEDITSQFIVCSAHFADDDFSGLCQAGVVTFRYLKRDAVPSLKLPVDINYNHGIQEPEIPIEQHEVIEDKQTSTKKSLKRALENEESINKEDTLNSGTDSAEENEQLFIENDIPDDNADNQHENCQIDSNQTGEYQIKIEQNVEDKDTKYAIVQQGEDGVVTYQLITDDGQLEMFEEGQYILQYEDESQALGSVLEQGMEVQEKQVKKRGRGRKRDKEVLEHFEIRVLSYDEQVAEIQSRASTSNYINAAFKCDLCFKGYMTQNTYNTHMAKHGEQSGPFPCVVCHRRCKTQLALKGHMLNHVYKYNCRKCEFSARNKAGAELHMNWHNGTVYECDMCEQSFERVSTLMTHVRIKHPSDYVCGLCGYSFIGEKGLNYHRKLKHRLDDRPIPEDGPICDTCDIQFVSSEALMRHIKVSPRHVEVAVKERNEPPQPRGLRRIRNRSPRKRLEKKTIHITTGEDDDDDDEDEQVSFKTSKFTTPVECELCPTTVSSPQEYHAHYRVAHPKRSRVYYPQVKHPHLCQYCGRVFACQATLKDHLLKHTGEATFTCSECGNQYHTMSSLQNHQRIHLGPRFPCPLCAKMFNQQSNRDRHFTYVHSDRREFECSHCHKLFKNNEDRALHVNHVHLKKPWPKRIRNRNTERRRHAEGGAEIIKIPIIGLDTSQDSFEEQDNEVDMSKDNEYMSKDNECMSKDNEVDMSKDNEYMSKDNEYMSKDNEYMSKDNEYMSKDNEVDMSKDNEYMSKDNEVDMSNQDA